MRVASVYGRVTDQSIHKSSSMIETVLEAKDARNFGWTDVHASKGSDKDAIRDYLEDLGGKFRIHPSTIKDCLLPYHLPKAERVGDYIFLILRYADPNPAPSADTLQALTKKLVVLIGDRQIITIHREPFSSDGVFAGTKRMQDNFESPEDPVTRARLITVLIDDVLESYRGPLAVLTNAIDLVERSLNEKQSDMTKALYGIRRRSSVYQRLLTATESLVKNYGRIAGKEHRDHTKSSMQEELDDPYIRDLIDTADALQYDVANIMENANDLLNLYFNLTSHRTNKLLYVLTIFSVFFTPLTFIAGFWGMNFENQPEFKWKYGYAFCIVLMAVAAIIMFVGLWMKGFIGTSKKEREEISTVEGLLTMAAMSTNV